MKSASVDHLLNSKLVILTCYVYADRRYRAATEAWYSTGSRRLRVGPRFGAPHRIQQQFAYATCMCEAEGISIGDRAKTALKPLEHLVSNGREAALVVIKPQSSGTDLFARRNNQIRVFGHYAFQRRLMMVFRKV